MKEYRDSEQNTFSEEADMIRRAQKDIQYFEPLYNKYYEAIFRYIFRKTENEELAADLTSTVFLKAMKALPKYEIRDVGFGAWLYRIATNETYQFFRKKKQQFLGLELGALDQVMICDGVEEESKKIDLLKKMIVELSDEEIKIIELKFFENRNFREVAFILDKKESAVKMKLYRALNKLKVKFEKIAEQY